VAAEADYIVSDDKHLLSYGKYGNIEIIKAADFLELF
jgi:predicted nucleic acid-binding protein